MNETRRFKGILRTQICTTLIACKDHGRKQQQHLKFLWMTLISSMRWIWKICFSLKLMLMSYEVKQYTHIHSANTEPCQHLQAWTRNSCMYNQTGLQGSCSCITLKDKVVSRTKISGSRFGKDLYLHNFYNRNSLSSRQQSKLPLQQQKMLQPRVDGCTWCQVMFTVVGRPEHWVMYRGCCPWVSRMLSHSQPTLRVQPSRWCNYVLALADSLTMPHCTLRQWCFLEDAKSKLQGW